MASSREMLMLEMALKNRGNEWGKYKSCDSSNSRDFSEEKLPTFDSDSDYDNDYEDEVPVETTNGMNELLENVNDIFIQPSTSKQLLFKRKV